MDEHSRLFAGYKHCDSILSNEEAVIDFIRQAHRDKRSLFFSVITECEVLSGIKSEFELHKVKLFTPRRCLNIDSRIAQKAGHRAESKNTRCINYRYRSGVSVNFGFTGLGYELC